MRRAARVIAMWLAVTVVGLGAVRWAASDAVAVVTRERYAHRRQLDDVFGMPVTRRPLVVWMGDSTIMLPPAAALPRLVQQRLERSGPAEVRTVSGPGFDFYAHYFVLERVVALRPDLVVLTANLRLLIPNPDAPGWYDDLASALPLRELPRTLTLPIAPARLSAARLLLRQCLAVRGCEALALDLDGFRTWATDAWQHVAAPILGPERGIPPPTMPQVLRKFYDISLTPQSALVQVLGATVERLRAAGIPTLVYFAPMPVALLASEGLDDPDRRRRDAAALRAATEAAGGRFVDLHDTLADDEVDAMAHYTVKGARRLAELLADPVGAAAGRVPSPAAAGITR